jgi:hypothetical protein
MPAKKYPPGTQPHDVVRDCAETAGKHYAVVLHHTGGSHLCLLYILNTDHTTYLSAAKISDNLSELDPTHATTPVWAPSWQAGKATLYDQQTLLSGIVNVYKPEAAVLAEYATNLTSYDYWVDVYHDNLSTTAAQATARAAGLLEGRRETHVTHRVSVIVQPNQVALIAAGMSIQIKATAALGGQYLDTWQTRRIAELRWEPIPDGTYWAHIQLDRPQLRKAPGAGSSAGMLAAPPTTDVPATTTTDWLWLFDEDAFDTTDTSEGGPEWTPGYIYSRGLDPSAQVDGVVLAPGDYHFRTIMRSRSPNPASLKGVRIVDGCHGGATLASSGNTVGQTATTVEFDFTVPSGSHNNIYFQSTGTASGANTEFHEAEITSGSGSPAYTGTPPPPPSTDSVGTIGTPGTYAPADHAHGAQSASVTPLGDAGEVYEAADLDSALLEDRWKQPVRVATTANGTLSSAFENGDTVDGVTLATGDRILLKDQSTGSQNGIYTVNASGAPTRAVDFDGDDEVVGAAVFVSEGTANGNTVFVCTNNEPAVVGTTALVFAELGGSGNIEDLPTAETDTALVLAPDGAGGVEFRAEVSHVPLVSVVGGVPGFVFDTDNELVLTEFTP